MSSQDHEDLDDFGEVFHPVDDYLAPFPVEAVSQKPGGGNFDYIAWETVVLRLIRLTNNNYSWTPIKDEIRELPGRGPQDPPLIVHYFSGILKIPGMGERFGSGVQPLRGGGGEDQFKSADSDAIKRAATKFGIGLLTYGPIDFDGIKLEQPTAHGQRPQQHPQQQRPPVQLQPPPQQAPRPAQNATTPLQQHPNAGHPPSGGPTTPGTVGRAPGGIPICKTEGELKRALAWTQSITHQQAAWSRLQWIATHQKTDDDTFGAWGALAGLAKGAIKIGGIEQQAWRIRMMAEVAPSMEILESILQFGVQAGINPDHIGSWVDKRSTQLKEKIGGNPQEPEEAGGGGPPAADEASS